MRSPVDDGVCLLVVGVGLEQLFVRLLYTSWAGPRVRLWFRGEEPDGRLSRNQKVGSKVSVGKQCNDSVKGVEAPSTMRKGAEKQ